MEYIWWAGALLLLVWLFNRCYLKPKRLYDYYAKIIPSLGYKLYKFPFKPMGAPLLEEFYRDTELNKDATYMMKHKLVGYDVVLSNILSHPYVVIINPNLSRVFNSAEVMDSIQKNTSFIETMYSQASRSLLFLNGKEWKERRRLLSKMFTWDYLMHQTSNIESICNQSIENAESVAPKGEEGRLKVDLSKLLSGAFSSVITSLFIGTEFTSEKVDGLPFNEALLELNNLAMQLYMNPLVLMLGAWVVRLNFNQQCRRYQALQIQIKTILYKHIRQSIKKHKKAKSLGEKHTSNSIIEHMIEKLEDRPGLEKELTEEVYLFVMAGSDTTTNLTITTLFYLYEHPQTLHKAREEIQRCISNSHQMSPESLKQLHYLQMAIKQANRLDGPTPCYFFREVRQDFLISDIPIKKGTMMNNFWRCNLYDSQYFDEPFSFKPERWEDSRYKEPLLQSITDTMFSQGPRTCLGKQLAHLESKIALTKFIQRYDDLKELKERIVEFKQVAQFKHTEVEVSLVRTE